MSVDVADRAHPTEDDTRTRLLDAAEHLFAVHGVDGASLRTITQRAGANLAAVNYHFGNKEGLVLEVFRRRVEPINRERLELLDRCTRKTAGDSPDLECIIHAFIAPALRVIQQKEGGHDIARIIGRTLSEPGQDRQRIFLNEFREVIERFTTAIGEALPALDRTEIHWRFLFMVGSMVHAGTGGFLLQEYSQGLCDPHDLERNVRRLVTFLTAGMSCPPPDEDESNHESI